MAAIFLPMKFKFVLLILITVIFQSAFNAQKIGDQKIGMLTSDQFNDLKEFLISKNLQIKDTIFIKYDFNKESCWNNLDGMGKEYIEKVKSTSQKYISDFNSKHKAAIAFKFREPGKRVNKLKLWDDTIIIDDLLFLKNLFFEKKVTCGTSAVILNDGSFLLYFGDSHFKLLDKVYQKEN